MNIFTRNVAMDLGTVNTLVYMRGRGVVLDEPSIVTLDQKTGKVIAVGDEARGFSGRHSDQFITVKPLRGGVINDFHVASQMIRFFLTKAFKRIPFLKPRLVAAVPTGITRAERRALIESAEKAGAGKVYLIEDPVAAAIGTGLRVDQPVGHMVIDIGGGTTEIAVVCKYTLACWESLRVAGDEISSSICNFVRNKHRIEIGEAMAEDIKIKVGALVPCRKRLTIEVRGKDISDGLPRTVTLTDEDVQEALRKPARAIVAAVKRVLESASPDIASDIAEKGVWITGGGAMLRGWSQIFFDEAGIDAHIAHDPLRSTIRGVGTITEQFNEFEHILSNGKPATYIRI